MIILTGMLAVTELIFTMLPEMIQKIAKFNTFQVPSGIIEPYGFVSSMFILKYTLSLTLISNVTLITNKRLNK